MLRPLFHVFQGGLLSDGAFDAILDFLKKLNF